MRPVLLARLDKVRPALILTREIVRPLLRRLTVAPITSMVRGLSTEVAVGKRNGLDQASVVSCDNIRTINVSDVGEQIGHLLPSQEAGLSEAIRLALDLM